MVGVAGRSKGCWTCRKRKIACGLQRPQCAQCIKSNRLCAGYQRRQIFIVNQDLPNGTHSSDRGSLIPNGIPVWKQKQLPKKRGSVPHVACVPAYRQMLFDCFLRSYVPVDELGPTQEDSWLTSLARIPNQTPALATAMLAMSLSQVGKVNHDMHLAQESLKHYTIGLRELQQALYDPKQMNTDETLAACFLLSMYELLECPDGSKTAYATHNSGCARLIQLRGPEGCSTGLAHKLFLGIRPQCIFQSLERHEDTFFTEPVWMEEPWRYKKKTVQDRLIDYIAQAPGIFGMTDKFGTGEMAPVEILVVTLEIIERCWKMDAELEEFYTQLEQSIPGPMYWPVLSTMSNSADNIDEEKGKVFPVSFQFFNLRMAAVVMLYWSQLCMMWHGMGLLYYRVMQVVPVDRKVVWSEENRKRKDMARLREGMVECAADCACRASGEDTECLALFDMSKLKPLGHRDDFLAPARNVCQSVEYCLQPKMLEMGPGAIAAPLAICLDTIKTYPFARRELEWGREVMLGLEERLPYLRWVRK